MLNTTPTHREEVRDANAHSAGTPHSVAVALGDGSASSLSTAKARNTQAGVLNTPPHLSQDQDSRCAPCAKGSDGRADTDTLTTRPYPAFVGSTVGQSDRREHFHLTNAMQSFRRSGFALDVLLDAIERDGVEVR